VFIFVWGFVFVIDFGFNCKYQTKDKEHGQRTTSMNNTYEQEHRRNNKRKLQGTRTTRATLNVFSIMVRVLCALCSREAVVCF
jgi:hypothetical protein